MSDGLICDGCFEPILDDQARVYRGWRFSGTAHYPPRQGDTTHAASVCQRAYLWLNHKMPCSAPHRPDSAPVGGLQDERGDQ